jgi:hypothetical protein
MSQLAQLGKLTALGISIRGTVRSFPDGRPTGGYPETGFAEMSARPISTSRLTSTNQLLMSAA